MTIRQAKALKAGHSFSRPSTNSHDNGKRIYLVITAHPNFHTVDQHGYHCSCGEIDPINDKPFFRTCEMYTAPIVDGSKIMQRAGEYLIEDLKVLTASYSHGNDHAKPEIDAVSEAINIIDRLRGTTAVSA